MPERLAIAAVIAHDCGLDDAGAVGIRARRDGEHGVRRAQMDSRRLRRQSPCATVPVTGDGLTDERPQFLLGHERFMNSRIYESTNWNWNWRLELELESVNPNPSIRKS